MENKLNFENLLVWQEAVLFSKLIYELSSKFPQSELYGLTSQIRRASTSIALNIAEGKGRNTTKDFIHFLYISKGSLFEVITCLKLTLELGFINNEQNELLRNKAFSILRKIVSLINSLEVAARSAQPAKCHNL